MNLRGAALAFVLGLFLLTCSCQGYLAGKYNGTLLHPRKAYIDNPSALGMPFEDVAFKNRSGKILRGWFIRNLKTDAVVVVCCGSSGNMSLHMEYAKFLYAGGLSVLLWDYQGFGMSEGKADIRCLHNDVVSALKYVKNRDGVGSIGLFGVSLGTVFALSAAVQTGLAKCVLVDSIYEPEEELLEILDKTMGRFFAFAMVKWFSFTGFPTGFHPHSSLARMKDIPVFLVHGEKDKIVPASGALRCYESAVGVRRLWILEDTKHTPDSLTRHAGEYQTQVVNYFRKYLKGEGEDVNDLKVKWNVTKPSKNSCLIEVEVENPEKLNRVACELLLVYDNGHTFKRHRIFIVPGRSVHEIVVKRLPEKILAWQYYKIRELPGNTWEQLLGN